MAQLNSQYRQLIDENWELIQARTNITQESLSSAKVTDFYEDKKTGVKHLYLQQMYDSEPIFDTYFQLHFDKSNKLIVAHNQFIPKLQNLKVSSTQKIDEKNSVKNAIMKVLLKNNKAKLSTIKVERKGTDGDKTTFEAPDYVSSSIGVKEIWYNAKGELKKAYQLDLDDKNSADWWEIVIDAQSSEILNQKNYTLYCSFEHNTLAGKCNHQSCNHTHSVKQNNATNSNFLPPISSTTNAYNVFAYPVESPIHGSVGLVESPWDDAPNASPLGWHDDGTNNYYNLRGNNVFATEDTLNQDTGGYSPISTDLFFNYPYNANAQPTQNIETSITNIFYWSNLMHDVWYQYGFDESSGNFQESNFGNGGTENDMLYADALDGSGTNNANFSAPPDGQNGRMQMFEWSGGLAKYLYVLDPADIEGFYTTSTAAFGGALPQYPNSMSGKLVIGQSTSAISTEVCDDVTNAADINGNIALVDRGDCTFATKVSKMQEAGATACVICNNVAGDPVTMAGTDPSITIPVVMLSKVSCDAIKQRINNGIDVNVNLSDTGEAINTDSGLDNGIICHEYGHGISIRLTGGPAVTCLNNNEQMGEGWSDWFGLVMTIEAGDTGPDKRGVGTYVSGHETDGAGIRLAPYSTDFGVNDYTYGDLCGVALPHGVGFIWGTMIWDLTWAFIDTYGYNADIYNGTGGNNMAMHLIVDAMKYQPCNPGFEDARDAILLADQFLYGGQNQKMIWQVFANRGLGYSANQNDADLNCDGVEAFDIPPAYRDILKLNKLVDKEQAFTNDTITYTLIVKNDASITHTNILVLDTLNTNLQFLEVTTGQNVSISADNVLSYDIASLATGEVDSCIIKTLVDANLSTNFNFFDDVETLNTDLNIVGSTPTFERVTTNAYSDTYSWFAENISTQSNQIMELPSMLIKNDGYLSFWHLYSTETDWDGGIVEISTDNGSNWQNMTNYFIKNPYNSIIESNPASAISEEAAFSGNSVDFINSVIDLSAFANQTIKLRFRFASDAYVGGNGWFIDDIFVFSGDIITNQAQIMSNQSGVVVSEEVQTTIIPEIDEKIQLKVFLEGYMLEGDTMATDVFNDNLAPDNQSFNIFPWNYYGTETIDLSSPWLTDVSDWILLQLHDTADPNVVVESKAVLLRKDGIVLDIDGTEGVSFSSLENGSGYFISISHRSHLATLSMERIFHNNTYDFTIDSPLVDNTFLKTVDNGHLTLYSGDFDHNGVVNNLDVNLWFLQSSQVATYYSWDADGNGVINVEDYNKWNANRAKVGQILH